MKLLAALDLEVLFRNILLAPELWKCSLHQTTDNRLYNKQLIFLESLLALWWYQTFSEPVRSIPSALGKVTPLLKSLLETSKIRSDDLRNIKDMDLSKLYIKYSLRVFLVLCRFVVWTTICLYYFQEWQHAIKLTSQKIGPSRCARFVFVILCNTL